mmetsp:Transcript_23/g.42  ORF Transcript_23/g.42 Transcript_23/m.42 type:complete len:168 (-) Transcript_23:232-735(-)
MGPLSMLSKCDQLINKILNTAYYIGDKTGLVKYIFGFRYSSQPEQLLFGVGFRYVCGYLPQVCVTGLSFMAQSTNEFNDLERMQVYFGHYPAGSPYKLWSYMYGNYLRQTYLDKDMGSPQLNMEVYGQPTPPFVDVTTVRENSVPIQLVAAKHDLIVYPEDSLILKD